MALVMSTIAVSLLYIASMTAVLKTASAWDVGGWYFRLRSMNQLFVSSCYYPAIFVQAPFFFQKQTGIQGFCFLLIWLLGVGREYIPEMYLTQFSFNNL